MKRIICFIFAFVLCAVLFCSAVSASNNYDGGNAVYTIAYDRSVPDGNIGKVDITVNQITGDSPFLVDINNGWLHSYFPLVLPNSGFYNIKLFNGTWFQFSFSTTSYSCFYCYYKSDDEVVSVPIVSNVLRSNDFFLYVDNEGNFEICVFDTISLRPVNERNISFTPNLSGVIFPYNQVPGGEGFNSSYQDGYDQGYSAGVDATYQDAYNLGFQRGQDSEHLVGNALNGFFNGLQGFVSPFLSIGVGSFTLGNLLGILITAFIVMIIVWVIRG